MSLKVRAAIFLQKSVPADVRVHLAGHSRTRGSGASEGRWPQGLLSAQCVRQPVGSPVGREGLGGSQVRPRAPPVSPPGHRPALWASGSPRSSRAPGLPVPRDHLASPAASPAGRARMAGTQWPRCPQRESAGHCRMDRGLRCAPCAFVLPAVRSSLFVEAGRWGGRPPLHHLRRLAFWGAGPPR